MASHDRITLTQRDLDEIVANAAARAYDIGFGSGRLAKVGGGPGMAVMQQRAGARQEAVIAAQGQVRALIRRGKAQADG